MRGLALLVAVAAAGCGSSSSCGLWDQARIEIDFDARTQNADHAVVTVTLGQTTETFDRAKRAGTSHDALEVDFPDKRIPTYGDMLTVVVTAVQNGAVLGVGRNGKHISPGCETLDISVTSISGACSGDSQCGAGTCTNTRCCYGTCPP